MGYLREVVYVYNTLGNHINTALDRNFFVINLANLYVRTMVLEIYSQIKCLLDIFKRMERQKHFDWISIVSIERCKKVLEPLLEKYRPVRDKVVAHILDHEHKEALINKNEMLKDIELVHGIFVGLVIAIETRIDIHIASSKVDFDDALRGSLVELSENPLLKLKK